MGGARVTTLVTLRKCTLGHKREIKTLKFVSASTKGFKGGLAWIKPSKKDMAVTFSYSRARSGWVQGEHAHSPTPQPGVAGRSRNPSPNTHTHTAHPCQEWLGASGASTQPNTPARSGGAQPKPEPKHTHPHRAPVPGVAGCKRSTHTSAHTPQHPRQERRRAAETRTQPQPRPKHKRHATVGNPVSIARALRQPVPCR